MRSSITAFLDVRRFLRLKLWDRGVLEHNACSLALVALSLLAIVFVIVGSVVEEK